MQQCKSDTRVLDMRDTGNAMLESMRKKPAASSKATAAKSHTVSDAPDLLAVATKRSGHI